MATPSRQATSLRPGQFRHVPRVAGAAGRMPEHDQMLLWVIHTTGIRHMEAGLFFHIDAKHLPKAEYDYISATAMKVIQGDNDHPPLFYGCSHSGDHEDSGGVTLNLWWEKGSEPHHEVYQTLKDSGIEESVLSRLCVELARVAGFMDAAYRCSPMRPKMNPSAADNLEYLVVKFALNDPTPFMGFHLYQWE